MKSIFVPSKAIHWIGKPLVLGTLVTWIEKYAWSDKPHITLVVTPVNSFGISVQTTYRGFSCSTFVRFGGQYLEAY